MMGMSAPAQATSLSEFKNDNNVMCTKFTIFTFWGHFYDVKCLKFGVAAI
jgi:hypothetical protein